ncbi:hypothetical protein EVAR_53388_1 [Eumeta japonica]|uniref:Uncharacterized protein n=1 Tax=Eumeta variegata TaxID=151549 RepID=A0A4C1Y5B6_EUMVA|nr:hypothetical protein EVAR_53388_1 [Eumeta japonica]
MGTCSSIGIWNPAGGKRVPKQSRVPSRSGVAIAGRGAGRSRLDKLRAACASRRIRERASNTNADNAGAAAPLREHRAA